MNYRRNEWTEVMAGTHYSLTYFDYVVEALLPEVTASFTFLHLSVYVEAGKQWIVWGSGCMHHEGVVNYLVVYITILTLDVAILLMNLGYHGETCLLLMNRLGNKDTRVFRSEIEEQRAAVLHHRNELFVTNPCGVEENVVAEVTNLINYLTCIVNAAIIGAELNNCQTNWSFSLSSFRITFSNEATDVVFIEAVSQNTTDGAVGVTGSFEVYRDTTLFYESAMGNGLMIVTVVKNDVAWCNYCVQNYLVRSRSTIQYKVCLISVVNLSSMLLSSQCRALMNQKVAHCNVGVAEVGSEHVFAEEIIECMTSWMLGEVCTTMMTWAVKLSIALFYVLSKSLEEWREHVVFVLSCCRFNLAFIESAVNFSKIHYTEYLLENVIASNGIFYQYQEYWNTKCCNLWFFIKNSGISISNYDGCNVGEISIVNTNDFTFSYRVKNGISFV